MLQHALCTLLILVDCTTSAKVVCCRLSGTITYTQQCTQSVLQHHHIGKMHPPQVSATLMLQLHLAYVAMLQHSLFTWLILPLHLAYLVMLQHTLQGSHISNTARCILPP
jgi:hypothetical protein